MTIWSGIIVTRQRDKIGEGGGEGRAGATIDPRSDATGNRDRVVDEN